MSPHARPQESHHVRHLRRVPWSAALGGSSCLFVVVFLLAFNFSSVDVGLKDAIELIANALSGKTFTPEQHSLSAILFEIRLPRIVVAALCGAALSCAGVVTQGVFRNPLASPSLLGVESGAGLLAAVAFYFGVAHLNTFTVPIAALVGALATTAVLVAFSIRFPHWPLESLLLAGFAVNSLQVALTSAVVALVLEEHQQGGAVLQWMLGSFSGRGWEHVAMSAPFILAGGFVATKLLHRLDALALGEDVATSLNVDIHGLRRRAIVGASLLVAGAVAVAGAIPFVSLVVPHFTRILIGPRHKRLMIISAINGMTLVLAADLIARTIRPPGELEVGIVTSLIGTPLFVALLLQRGRR